MKSDKYEPRICEMCGKLYKPGRFDQRTCGSVECVRERKRRSAIQYQNAEYRERKREFMRRKRDPGAYETKPDTIIGEGYAERQMEQTLKMVGKVNTEL